MKNKTEYVPFGDEWVKEMNKFPKSHLIDMLKKALIKNQQLNSNDPTLKATSNP